MDGGFSPVMVARHPVLVANGDKKYLKFLVVLVVCGIQSLALYIFIESSLSSYASDYGALWLASVPPNVAMSIFILMGLDRRNTHRGAIFRTIVMRGMLCVPFIWIFQIAIQPQNSYGWHYQSAGILERIWGGILSLPIGVLLLMPSVGFFSAMMYFICRILMFRRFKAAS